MSSTTLTVHAYDWTVDDSANWNDEDHVAIHAWCLDRNSVPHLLRFTDFPAFCYVELPQFIGQRYIRWDNTAADRFLNWLQRVLKDDAPQRGLLKHMSKVYYYRGQRRYPMLLLTFKSLRAMQHCEAFLQKPHRVDEFGGMVACKVWETGINIVRKLLTLQKCRYSQWFSINATLVDDDNRISTLEHEYVVEWRSLTPLPNSQTKGWTTHPRILAFDIECYSNNHKAMPQKHSALHVAYMISLIFQRVGNPETRKRYAIILGDCDTITLPPTRPAAKPGEPDENVPGDLNVEVIRVATELELIDTMSRLIQELDPEIITGYNILGFDYPYLDARLKRKRLPPNIWRPMGRLRGKLPTMTSKTWRSDAYGFNEINIMHIDGRISIDLLPLVRRDYKLDKYDLDFVSRFFLGEGRGKHDIKAPEMFRIFEDLKRLYDEYLQIADKYSLPRTFSEIYTVWNANQSIDLTAVPGDERTKVETFLQTCRNVQDASPPSPTDVATICDYHKSVDNMTRVMRYCIQDSELVVDLFEKLSIWIALVEMSNIVGVTVMELFTRGQQVRCLSQIYDLASQKDYVVDKRDVTPVKFSGGFVYEPIPGLYENIICLDFASLYPSIIRAYNICFTTLVPPELEAEVPDDRCNVIEFDQEETGDIGEDEDSDDETLGDETTKPKKKPEKRVAHRRYKFVKNEVHAGLLPELVKRLVEERSAVRAHLDGKQNKTTGEWIIPKEKDPVIRIVLDKRQLALKVTANSFFGFLGVQEGGKMPLIEGAMSITAKGRELINTVNRYLRDKYGGTIVYGDTDSCMVDLHIASSKECNEWGHRLSLEISGDPEKGIPGLFPPPLKMEFEKAMRLLCIKKKKYAAALIDKEGNHKLADKDILKKGIVLARRDNCKWLRRVYMNVLRNILTSKPIHETMDIIVDSIQELLQGRVSYKDLVIIRELNSNYKSQTYFMKVFADQLRKIGKQANPGDRLEYVVVNTGNPNDKVGMRMRLPEMYLEAQGTPHEEKIDIIYYLEHALMNPIDQLFQIGYKQPLESLERLGYKPKGRYHERNIREPVKMMVRMLLDHRDINVVKTMIRQPDQFQVPITGVSTVAVAPASPSPPVSPSPSSPSQAASPGPRLLRLRIISSPETPETPEKPVEAKKVVLE
jgi:DNA polymerase delta subunit 1